MKKMVLLALILLFVQLPFAGYAAEPVSTERVVILFADDVDESLFDSESFQLHHVFEELSAVSATVPVSAIPYLKQDPNIVHIEADPLITVNSHANDLITGDVAKRQDVRQQTVDQEQSPSNQETQQDTQSTTNQENTQPTSDGKNTQPEDNPTTKEENNQPKDDPINNLENDQQTEDPTTNEENEQQEKDSTNNLENNNQTEAPTDDQPSNQPSENQTTNQEEDSTNQNLNEETDPSDETETEDPSQNETPKKQIIDWGYRQVLADEAKEHGWTGKGVKIGIIDTGVRTDHPDIKLAGGVSFVGDESSYNDDEGHGTHVAGIIAAQDNNIGIVGVASDAELYAIKALNSIGIGNLSDVIAGIQWAVDHEIDIINLSLTSHQNHFLLERAVNNAYNEGILIVAASGNATTTLNADTDVLFPARYDSVIAVGAVNKSNHHASFSYFGSALEFVAPGEKIYSTFSNNEMLDYSYMNGTSMAAPYVSAVAALYKQAYPEFSGKEIRKLMQLSAHDLGKAGKDPYYGYGLVQAPTEARSFIDIPKAAWYAEEVEFLAEQGIVNGYEDHRFLPNEPVTRAEAITMIGRTLDYDQTKQVTSFYDVPQHHYASGYISKASAAGVINGYPDGSFQPTDSIIRGDVAAMLQRAYELPITNEARFTDVDEAQYFYQPIQALYSQRITTGYPDQTYRPQAEITRAEFSVFLARVLEESYR